MKSTKATRALRRALFPAAALLLFAGLTLFAGEAADAAQQGLILSLRTAVPALFPFFVAGALLSGSGLVDVLGRVLTKPMHGLFGLGGSSAAALLLGLSGGYPAGAQAVCEMYRAGAVSRDDAERLAGFCNNSGPAFIIGVAGVAVCGSAQTGVCLYIIHALAALITGMAMTPPPKNKPLPPLPQTRKLPEKPAAAFLRAVRESFTACLTVTAFITFFSVLLALLRQTGALRLLALVAAPGLGALGFPPETADAAAAGILELTNGLALLPGLALPRPLLLPLCAFMLGFGGLSVHCQALSLLQQAGLSPGRHFWGKTLHGAISAALAVIWCCIAPHSMPVFAPVSATVFAPVGAAFSAFSAVLYGCVVLFAVMPRTGAQGPFKKGP